ncbi:MAG: hypothetical protein DMD78_10725 [Candidatus Rokuibacteriota bacterium]|nr:MAG: hypothetical protein DMD78_10725 [Candidatus Rokubacteria bacterium]
MSASLEAYLVKLYLDRDARRAFLADPRRAATVAELDRDGLELAARSFAAKRGAQAPRGRWARLLARWRRWRGR